VVPSQLLAVRGWWGAVWEVRGASVHVSCRRATLRALVTGIGGFVGAHLTTYLLEAEQCKVWGLDLVEGRAAQFGSRITLQVGDLLLELPALKELFQLAKPDCVFHLAAQAFVPASWQDPWSTLENNIRGQLNILLAALSLKPPPRVLVVGSAEEYGLVAPDELPVRETNTLRPYSPYAVSKVAQDMLGYQYYASHKLPTVRVRPFHHIGPGQSPAFVASDFAKQIAEAEAGLREPLMQVGNLEARRDFTDVRDMVRAYYLAVTKGEPGEVYNIGAERSYSVRELLDMLLAFSTVPIRVEQDPARLRPSDVPELLCDCSRFRAQTGWTPEIDLQQTLRDILDYWRAHVRSA
jgi:GDP-4-dehydro-6-deoxy-D-mannose reductase